MPVKNGYGETVFLVPLSCLPPEAPLPGSPGVLHQKLPEGLLYCFSVFNMLLGCGAQFTDCDLVLPTLH